MRLLRSPAALLIGALALAGCSSDHTNLTGAGGGFIGGSGDEAAVSTVIAATPGVVEDGLSDDGGQVSASIAGGLAAVRPLTFWRTLTTRDRTFEFAFSDTDSTGRPTRAIVTIRTHFTGTFNLLAVVPSDTNAADSSRQILHKPLDETRTRLVLLRRAALGSTDRRVVWRIAAVSGVEVVSNPSTTHIESVRVQAAGVDTTIIEPVAFFRLQDLIRVQPGGPVTLTVRTQNADDVVVLHLADRRFVMHSNGDGTFTAQWHTSAFVHGLRGVDIDALSNGTLYDDSAPYSSDQWIVPFVIAPELLLGPPV